MNCDEAVSWAKFNASIVCFCGPLTWVTCCSDSMQFNFHKTALGSGRFVKCGWMRRPTGTQVPKRLLDTALVKPRRTDHIYLSWKINPQKPNPVMPLAGFTLPCMEMSINHQLYKPHWPRTECRVFRKPLHRSTARDPKDATTLWTMSARRVCDINYANVARLTDRYTIIEQTDYNQGELV